jgi:hypothetical protein
MAPSNEKEANSAGEQNAEGEDGAVGGARSQVTGSRPPRLGSTVVPEAFHTEGSVFRQCCLHALGDSGNVWQAHKGKIAAISLRYESMCVRTGVR